MTEMDTVRIAIVIPTHSTVTQGFALDLAKLAQGTAASVPRAVLQFGINMLSDTYLPKGRETLAAESQKAGATHLFWLDSDMRFPPDAMLRLLKHDVPIVGCNYATRGMPPVFVARRLDSPNEKLATLTDSTGTEKVAALGFGCLLMRTELLDAIERPWFFAGLPNEYDDNGMPIFIGEDVWFCNKVRAAGYDILVDHDLSKEIMHVGWFNYHVGHAETAGEANPDGNGPGMGAAPTGRGGKPRTRSRKRKTKKKG